jgi:16S rRNA (cytosine967-C5)-methyltransferase
LIDRWISEYGQKNTEQIVKFNNIYQKIYFRHNPIRISGENLQDRLLEKKYSIDIACSNSVIFFYVDKPGVLLKSDIFRRGFISVQDISQSLAVRLLDPKSGETIVDACAAPGGKTGFIAQLTGSSGNIHAYDISQGKVRLLKNEIFRLGIDFVNYGVADARTDSFPMADKILLDVPCSGTGVLARRADLRWNRKREDIEKLLDIQRQILANMAHYCKPGGIIVYSTCSIEPEENWSNIEWFMHSYPAFKIESADLFIEKKWCNENGAIAILPHVHRQTGSFAVRLINKG